MKGTLKILCPSMAVRYVSRGLSLTDQLDCQGTLELDDGSPVQSYAFRFPATYVRRQRSAFDWQVDPCGAETFDQPPGLRIFFAVEAEKCRVRWNVRDGLWMDVKSARADVQIMLPDGRIGTGEAVLPRCKSFRRGPGLWVVESVVVTGWVEVGD